MVMLVLALGPVLKDSLRTGYKSLILILALRAESLTLTLMVESLLTSMVMSFWLVV